MGVLPVLSVYVTSKTRIDGRRRGKLDQCHAASVDRRRRRIFLHGLEIWNLDIVSLNATARFKFYGANCTFSSQAAVAVKHYHGSSRTNLRGDARVNCIIGADTVLENLRKIFVEGATLSSCFGSTQI
jgi:hypothetical protein